MPKSLETIPSYFRLVRFDSWQVWLFNFLLGCILFGLPQINRFIPILISFSLATSSIFILNQYFDQENDKNNNLKKELPIASGEVKPKVALAVFFIFICTSLITAFFVDISIFLLLLALILLGVGYSTPPLFFKNRPGLDVVVCGIGAGIIPFFIGVQTTSFLTFQFEFPWMIRRYQDALFTVLPIFLVQCAGQIYQVVGDYEADTSARINTFAVKYGRQTALRFATIALSITVSLPIIYELCNLSLTPYLSWYLIAFAFLVPFLLYFLKRAQDTSERNFKKLRDISRKVGAGIVIALISYVFIVRLILNGV